MKKGVQGKVLEPTVEQITAELRCTDAPDTPNGLGCANKKCRYRDVDGACDITSMCFDAANLIDRLNDFQNSQCAKLLSRITELEAQLAESQRRERAAVEVVRCKDCRWKDTVLCRASKSVKYDLRREKHTYHTCMEPDGFCSIGERGPQKAGEGETE